MVTETSIEQADGEHRRTYSLFKGMLKWGTIAAAIVTVLVVLLIS